jgi:hypothetical protein
MNGSQEFAAARDVLADIAWQASRQGRDPRGFVVLCVVVKAWPQLALALTTGPGKSLARLLGPLTCGLVRRAGFAEMMSGLVPVIAAAVRSDPAPGAFHVVVCFDGGAAVFEVEPRPEPS